jgi:hypothetical protein
MKKILYSFIVLLSGLIFNSCSTDEQQNDSKGLVDLRTIQFTLSEGSFGEDKQLTRSVAEPTKQMVDLGDGLTAEVAVERDAKDKMETRVGTSLKDGNYFIYAVDSDGKRIKGAGKIAKGVVKDGELKLDERTSLILPAGQYTFVCYNEYVTDDGDKLTFTDDSRALVGTTTQTITASPHIQKVAFVMKRQVARVRFKITAYTQAISNIDAKLVSTANQPASISYSDLIANPQTVTSMSVDNEVTFPTTSNTKNILAFDYFTPYQYYLAGTDGTALKLSFSQGTIYQKSLAGKEFTLNNLGILEGNASYTVRIKLMTNPLYLYQDGTIGIYEERGTRTPIGVMITEKTKENAQPGEEGAGLAVSLKWARYTNGYGDLTEALVMRDSQHRDIVGNVEYYNYGRNSPEWIKKLYNDLNGYYYTWNPESHGEEVKIYYPTTPKAEIGPLGVDGVPFAYYVAGHYDPGVVVTGTNVSKWFLPTVGQFILAYRKLKIIDVQLSDMYGDVNSANFSKNINTGTFKDEVFSKVGGEPLHETYVNNNKYNEVWTSNTGNGLMYMVMSFWQENKISMSIEYCYSFQLARPFVHF